jgi:hypothetical protein
MDLFAERHSLSSILQMTPETETKETAAQCIRIVCACIQETNPPYFSSQVEVNH